MLKSREKKQSVVRLDAEELDRMAAIQSQLGLSKTGVIRRLIRDFKLESDSANHGSKFIVDGQISKNIFTQLTVKNIGTLIVRNNFPGLHYEMWFSSLRESKSSIIGYVDCSSIDRFQGWDYVLVYELEGILCCQKCLEGKVSGNALEKELKISESGDHLQQIFIV